MTEPAGEMAPPAPAEAVRVQTFWKAAVTAVSALTPLTVTLKRAAGLATVWGTPFTTTEAMR